MVFANTWYDRSWTGPDAVIAGDHLRRELSRRLAGRGHELHVVQEHPQPATVQDGAVTWHFVPPSALTRASRALLRAAGRVEDAVPKSPTDALARAVGGLAPDLIHTFDLAFYPSLWLLGRLGAPIVAHFHGGAPARTALLRRVERAALAPVDRLLFTTRERGAEWVRAGAVPDEGRIAEVFESSSVYTPGPAERLPGHPAVLHVGRLDPVKDPLTTVAGFRRVLDRLPDAHLTLAFRDAPLRAEVESAVRGLPVTLLGAVADPERLYRGADLLVQASLREVCGMAPLESLACGTPVVLSDIPPFRRLTDGGRVGALFPIGDAEALADAIHAEATRPTPRTDVRAWFDAGLSFDALAAAVDTVYASVNRRPTRT